MTLTIILMAKYLIILPALLAGYVLYRLAPSGRKRMLVVSVISLPLAYIIAKMGSYFYFDVRPFVVGNITPLIPHAADNGFPSDHTLLAAALAGVTFLFDRRLGLLSLACAILIGAARMLAHVHHGVDIAGSMLIAGASVWLTAIVLERLAFPKNEAHS